MARRIVAAAILVSAVMLLVAAAPVTSADVHTITKGAKGPRASAQTWEYVAVGYGIWTGHIVNNGLRSLVVDVNDVTSGVPQESLHQRMNFGTLGINPVGETDTEGVVMADGRTYEITVTPNGPRGSSCTVEDIYVVLTPPVAAFDIVAINNLEVTVDGSPSTGTSAIQTYEWSFGDGAGATGMVATHTYAADGTYDIQLTVTDLNGLWGSTTQQVTVSHAKVPPVPAFTASTDFMTVSVDASASTDDGTMTFHWEFGDGTAAEGVTASHTYLVAGTYTIWLTVTDNDLLSASISHDVTVVEPLPPVAVMTADSSFLTVTVSSAGSYDPDGTITSYGWTFGDGATASGPTASHKYALGGTYTVTLTVTDSEGLTASDAKDVTVVAPVPPVATFTVSKLWLDVAVDGSASYDPDGTIATYDWSFGDGASASGPTASHSYAAGGTYTIALTVTDQEALSTTTTQQVTVEPKPDNPPVAAFTYTVDGLTVSVNAASSSDDNGIVSYSWNWGDGSSLGSGVTASHTYSVPGGVSALAARGALAPMPPYYVIGYTKGPTGTLMGGATVTITNVRTGASATTTSDPSTALYNLDIANGLGYVAGDQILVTATLGTLSGQNTGFTAAVGSYVQIDVTMQQTGPVPFDVTITLTVTDASLQSSSVSETITLYP